MTTHMLDTPRCAAWSFMGSGKTVATLTALDTLSVCGEPEPALVIAPLRVAKNVWTNESHKWAHLRHTHVVPIIGDVARRRRALRIDASVHTINFDNIAWLVAELGDKWPYRTVIWDEATRLSGFRLKQGTTQARAMAQVAHTKVKRFIQLTGTPAPNGLAKLWGQLWMLDRGARLGMSYKAFMARWFQRSFDGYGVEPLPHTQKEIQGLVGDLCMSVEARDWFDLEEPLVTNIYVDLPIEARARYREMEKTMFTQIGDRTAEAFGAAARTQKCLQLANGAVYVDHEADSDDNPRAKEWRSVHEAKLDALESIVEEANGMPVLCAYEFKSDLARILRAFPRAVNINTEDGMAVFMAGKSPLGCGHPKSIGHGVDGLQDVTCIVAFFGHNWDLELYMQFIERIGPVRQHQSGHERVVQVYHIIARDTVDELVMERRESKRSVQDILLAAVKRSRQ